MTKLVVGSYFITHPHVHPHLFNVGLLLSTCFVFFFFSQETKQDGSLFLFKTKSLSHLAKFFYGKEQNIKGERNKTKVIYPNN